MIKALKCTALLLLICKVGITQISKEIDSLRHQLLYAGHDTSRVILLSDMSYWYLSINPDSSMKLGRQALGLAQQIQFLRGEARAFATLGNTTRFLGDIPKGMELLFKGLQIAEQHHFPFETTLCLNDIGVIYADELQDYTKALSYYVLARKIFDATLHDIREKKYGLLFDIDMGIAYQQTGRLDSSLHYRQKAIDEAILLGSGFYPVTMMFMGGLQFEMGNRQAAMEYLQKSIHAGQMMHDPRVGAEANNLMADFFNKMKLPDSSAVYAKRALADAESINHKQAILKASSLLSELYGSENTVEAYKYLKIARSVTDELYGAKKVQSLQKLISEEQARQRDIAAGNIAYQNRIKQYFLIAGLVVFLLIAFILYRNNKRNRKANAVLQLQKEEIQTTLTQLKSTQSQLIQSEKMASLGELTAGIAHEIQNPLNFVNNFSEVNKELLLELNEEIEKENYTEVKAIAKDVIENEEKINHHGKRADAIVKGMLQHSQSISGVKEPTNINALADEYLRLSYHGLLAKDKTFTAILKTDFDETIGNINIIPQDIGRVLLNIYNNALYAVNEKQKAEGEEFEPTVSVTTKKIGDKPDSYRVEIFVSDNGNGIPQKITDKIFQPFFTTKPTGQGTGLGLSLAYDIVKAHGGEIKVEATEGEGSEFIIQLPIV